MNVFIYEYTCATGAGGDPLADALRAEGWAMLSAVVADFERIPGVRVTSLLAESTMIAAGSRRAGSVSDRSPPVAHAPGSPQSPEDAGVDWRRVHDDEESAFRRLARAADYTLVIAPECGGILADRAQWVREVGGRSLGGSVDSIRLTSDKWALGEHWRTQGMPTPPATRMDTTFVSAARSYPVVVKPRHGAGSQATFLCLDACAAHESLCKARDEGCADELILQSFVPGITASVALLLGSGGIVPLLPAAQRLSSDGRFKYEGGELPLEPALQDRAVRLAIKAVQCVEGLAGYVGVDLILGNAEDGSGDVAIEINPRMTTSYVGLRALCDSNLAEAMLAVVLGHALPEIRWKPGSVRFYPDGRIQLLSTS